MLFYHDCWLSGPILDYESIQLLRAKSRYWGLYLMLQTLTFYANDFYWLCNQCSSPLLYSYFGPKFLNFRWIFRTTGVQTFYLYLYNLWTSPPYILYIWSLWNQRPCLYLWIASNIIKNQPFGCLYRGRMHHIFRSNNSVFNLAHSHR